MGSRDYMKNFIYFDWRLGVNELMQQDMTMLDHMDPQDAPYYGGICTLESIRFNSTTGFKTDEDINVFIQSRLDNMGKGEAEVIAIKTLKNAHVGTKKKEVRYAQAIPFNINIDRRGYRAILVSSTGYPKKYGTIKELDEYVVQLMCRERFANKYYILATDKIYFYEPAPLDKKTQYTLELPIKKFIIYGVAAC